MKLKYLLKVNCNDELRRAKKFEFSFQRTHHISVRIAKDKYTISALIGKDYRKTNNQYLINLMREGIRRAMILHLFLYEAPIKNQCFELTVIDGNECKEIIDTSFMPYSMINSKLLRPLPEYVKETQFLQKAMSATKTEKGSESAALSAYLYSKSRAYETERFQNLWMAFNGFYSSRRDAEKHKDKPNIERILRRYHLGNEMLIQRERESLGKSPLLALQEVSENTFLKDIRDSETKTYKIISHYIEKHVKKDITVEGFIVGELSYYLRCTLFHANRPIQLIAFKNDLDLKCLRLVNAALENFLDEHLTDIFEG